MDRTRVRELGGELLIVVFGILIALAVDQALADRGERKLEGEYLLALRADLEGTVDWLEWGTRVNRRKEVRIVELDAFRDARSETPVDTVAVAYSLALLTFHPIFPVQKATFEDLTGTGNLRVIRDPELRRDLVEFYLWVETFAGHERAMVDRSGALKVVVDRHLPPVLLSELAELGWNGSSDAWAPLDSLDVPNRLRAAAAASDLLDGVRTDTDLGATLSVAMDDVYLQRRQYELLRERAEAVLVALGSAGK